MTDWRIAPEKACNTKRILFNDIMYFLRMQVHVIEGPANHQLFHNKYSFVLTHLKVTRIAIRCNKSARNG